jgi:helicase
VSSTVGLAPNRLAAAHLKIGQELGVERQVKACNETLGTDYELAIAELLLVETSWVVRKLDDGNRQNVPDLLVELGDLCVLIECKTCTKSPALIKKEEAWAVIQKAADFDKAMRRVTLGKPAFDETSKKKAAASPDITLAEHSIFIEGLLRVHGGTLSPHDFLSWLGAPGVAEMDRLNGNPTYIQGAR